MEENKEILYKNTSKLDDEEITVFQNYILKKTILITSIAFSLIFAGLGVGLSFVYLALGIVLIVCGLLGGFVLMPYLLKETVKKQNKETLGDKEYLNTYDFYEGFLFTSSQTKNKETGEYEEIATQKVLYSELYKAVSSKFYLFIYINKRQSFVVNAKGMTKGTIEDVITLLKNKNVKVITKT